MEAELIRTFAVLWHDTILKGKLVTIVFNLIFKRTEKV
jgi:hypothetical protein